MENEKMKKLLIEKLRLSEVVVDNINIENYLSDSKLVKKEKSGNVWNFFFEVEDVNENILLEMRKKTYTSSGKELKFFLTERAKESKKTPDLTESIDEFEDERKLYGEYNFIKRDILFKEGGGENEPIRIKKVQVNSDGKNITTEGKVFDASLLPTRNGGALMTVKITDFDDSIYLKKWLRNDELSEIDNFKIGTWIRVTGNVELDSYSKNQRAIWIERSTKITKTKKDNAEKKRIELHAHTKMSKLDGVAETSNLVKRAIEFGHEAIAITDHEVVHSFPDAYNTSDKNEKIKILYGAELNVFERDKTKIFYNSVIEKYKLLKGKDIKSETFIVFDLETTGLSQNFNKIIEIAAIRFKMKDIEKILIDLENGEKHSKGKSEMLLEKLEVFETFVNPKEKLSNFIMELTNISQEQVDNAPNVRDAMRSFMEWLGPVEESILVAHNANFDIPFLESVYRKTHDEDISFNYLDTLLLARHLYPNRKKLGLKILTKFLGVNLESHHRAIDDTKALALAFIKMMEIVVEIDDHMDFLEEELRKKTENQKFTLETLTESQYMQDINEKLVFKSREEEMVYSYHVTVLAMNDVGLKNLFKLISDSHINYFTNNAKIPLEKLLEKREGLLLGSACSNNDVFQSFLRDGRYKTEKKMEKYDYIEIQPPHQYSPLIDMGVFKDKRELKSALLEFINMVRSQGKLLVATGDVHQILMEDTKIREMYITTQRGTHPLANTQIKEIPANYLMTTNEMKKAFSFLEDEDFIHEIVVENTHIINDKIEKIKVIKDELFTPHMENAEEEVTDMVYQKAFSIYGEILPKIVEERIKIELESIIKNGFSVIYLISSKLVKKSMEDGYIVGSRGSVGSSLVATLMEITEVNPLIPHYTCPKCKRSEFFEKGEYSSGYDLPDKVCPDCGTSMLKDGQDIPFETFLGFKGDKVPDIDLNFSGEYQSRAHDYTKVLFGEDKVFRAGTISTIAEKTGYGYAMNFQRDFPEKEITPIEVERLVKEGSGVKKTTGKHAGGIIVVPDYMEIYDITPIQYPPTDKDWKTTHFDFHAIHDNLLKLDLLGHDDPTILKILEDITGIKPKDVPIDDKKIYDLFRGVDSLDFKYETNIKLGSLGIPEFGTDFVQTMLSITKPSSFSELVQISGLSHGTDVWIGNALDLIKNNGIELKDVIGCRDDIMVFLIKKGMDSTDAFNIMELTRKGKFTPMEEGYIKKMKEHDVPDWYIKSCIKIKYMFPKAHAAAYVMSAMRIAWFKVHEPLAFYASYFGVRGEGLTFEVDVLNAGYEVANARLQEKQNEIKNSDKKMSATEGKSLYMLKMAVEMLARGYHFSLPDIYRSESKTYVCDDENKSLIFPLQSIDGLGESVALNVVRERNIRRFSTQKELQSRTKISKTVMEKMRILGIFKEMKALSEEDLREIEEKENKKMTRLKSKTIKELSQEYEIAFEDEIQEKSLKKKDVKEIVAEVFEGEIENSRFSLADIYNSFAEPEMLWRLITTSKRKIQEKILEKANTQK